MYLDIEVVGTNHRHTALAGRELLALNGGCAREALARLRSALSADECVMLRTCNRVEIYYVASQGMRGGQVAEDAFCRALDPTDAASTASVYHHSGERAARHLFEVASGLDSMVLGEHEILGQVKSALYEAVDGGHAGRALTRLFNQAIRVGKRARRETAISSGIFSVGQCAVRVAQESLGTLKGKRVVVFGAGRIAKMAAKHMAAQGTEPIAIFSRTAAKAQHLADMLAGRAITALELPELLRRSDILVGCAAAPHYVIDTHQIQRAMGSREGRPLVVIDLGVPRNVEPSVGSLPGVRLFNIDDMESVVAENVGAREAEIQRVHAIVDEEVSDFQRLEAEEEARGVISGLRASAEAVRQECLRQACGNHLSDADLEFADYLTDLLVRKLLHKPTVALRQSACAGRGNGTAVVSAVRRLFGLNGEQEQEDAVGSAVQGGSLDGTAPSRGRPDPNGRER